MSECLKVANSLLNKDELITDVIDLGNAYIFMYAVETDTETPVTIKYNNKIYTSVFDNTAIYVDKNTKYASFYPISLNLEKIEKGKRSKVVNYLEK